MSERIDDAKSVAEIVRKYAESTCRELFWRDVISCKYYKKKNEWHVVYEASPSFFAPYYRYEAIINAASGKIKLIKRLK